LRTSQHFCGGEASVFLFYLLIVNFLFQFLTVNFHRSCFSTLDVDKEIVVVIILSQRTWLKKLCRGIWSIQKIMLPTPAVRGPVQDISEEPVKRLLPQDYFNKVVSSFNKESTGGWSPRLHQILEIKELVYI